MRRSYGRRMIAFLMAFIMALSVLFQSDIAIGGIAQVLAAQSQNVATASDAEKQSDVGDSVATLAADELWVAEKFQSNSEIAGSPRDSFRASLILDTRR